MSKVNHSGNIAKESAVQALELFHPAVRDWFAAAFAAPTRPQLSGWPVIARGESTLILAPTGTGKTLAAFLWCIQRIMFTEALDEAQRCRVLYISPIKALAVDVERNLRAPLVGIAQSAQRLGAKFHSPKISVRTGDTPAAERSRFQRHPGDILITTPESLYLLLTSNARDALRSIEVVVVDEIHALVPTKRGSHLALSLERLEHLAGRRLQRIGLSATQRPLEEVAHFLGGVDVSRGTSSRDLEPGAENVDKLSGAPANGSEIGSAELNAEEALAEFESAGSGLFYRPVTIVDASEPKRLDLRIEVPVEDMARLGEMEDLPSGPASQGPVRRSIWSAIHPKLLEQIRAHRSSLIFVNSRRLAERISGAINELAGETLVRAHHGSVAVAQRKEIEDRLKLGTLRGIVATSSLELGIDMGAVELVIQIESPPSVASGMQRVGRANHTVDGTSAAIIFPKYRGDLIACAAMTRAMYLGQVESVHYPRNPLDVLAQQIVATVSLEEWAVDDLFSLVRSSSPFAALPRSIFEGLLDMLSGRYPSDEFAELRPRIIWDRVANKVMGRHGSQRMAIINGGTIPDRGLYGVFLAGAAKGARVGELDEEMVFESRQGDTIILGASTWRIEEISHNQVIVTPAPGEPGKMPFWHGDSVGRPAEFGKKIGEMIRELLRLPRSVAFSKLVHEHSLDANAADNLLNYLGEQTAATTRIPSDEDIIVEICRDEMGDRRVCVLTPFGRPVHIPWCMAVTAKLRAERGLEVESMWSDDGFVLRLPDSDESIASDVLFPTPAEFKDLVLRQLGSTSLFAAKFREAAGRALLLPKRRPGLRAPLWQQRKRAADLLAVASQFSSFPILLETYRECIRDVFDLPAAANILSSIQRGAIKITNIESTRPSPFAASLLFSYVANYIYEGDAPLAERRAQALSIDQSQLEELLGDSDLRDLLDANALDEVEVRLQSLDPESHARQGDGVNDLLLKLGDLAVTEIAARCETPEIAATVADLVNSRRAIGVRIAGEFRYIPVEYASRYRDALGVPLPPGLPEVFLTESEEPLREILRRYARTHGPFTSADVALRYGLPNETVQTVLRGLHGSGKLLEGEFRPGGRNREWCDPDVLQRIRRKSLARLRREVEPVVQRTFARLVARWQGVTLRRRGFDALLDTIETLQGAPLLASELESEILPARLADYRQSDLDAVMAAGEVVWTGVERVGERDGRVALYLTESLPLLVPPLELASEIVAPSEKAVRIVDFLARNGASFFAGIHAAAGGGFSGDTREALWELAWSGKITNDTFFPVREFLRARESRHDRKQAFVGAPGSQAFLPRLRSRTVDGSVQGRWSLVRPLDTVPINVTEWSANIAQQLLVRHGIVLRETAIAENIPRGYPTVYPALKTMEESGVIRRGMFVAGLGAAQFAMPGAIDMLRSLRVEPQTPEVVFLAATDPANPYGTLLPWPRNSSVGSDEAQLVPGKANSASDAQGDSVPSVPANSTDQSPLPMLSRTRGAGVILINGELCAFLRRQNPALRVFLPESEPEESIVARALSKKLGEIAIHRQGRKTGLLIGSINGVSAREHFLARFLEDTGFVNTSLGFQMRRVTAIAMLASETKETSAQDDPDEIDTHITESA